MKNYLYLIESAKLNHLLKQAAICFDIFGSEIFYSLHILFRLAKPVGAKSIVSYRHLERIFAL